MLKILFGSFLFLVSINYAQAATETVKIYPIDDAFNQLWETDGITDWTTARTYQGILKTGPFSVVSNDDYLMVRADKQTGEYRIYRDSFVFDTSSIPGNASLISVALNLYRKSPAAGGTDIVVTSHVRASTTSLAKSDWYLQNYGTDEFAREEMIDNQYTVFNFNEFGIEYIDTDDYTILGLMADDDFDNIDPGISPQAEAFYSIEAAGTDKDPYLEVIYEIPDEPESLVDLLAELIEKIETGDFDKNEQSAYLAHVKKIEAFFFNGQLNAAENQIKQFMAKVRLDIIKGDIVIDEGEELLDLADQILEIINTTFGVARDGGVPLLTQIASPYPPESADWADMVYADGRANYSGSCGSTIRQCGCALASFAMLGQSYGMMQGVDGSDATPPNIDAWLLANDGYSATGDIIWEKAIKYFGEEKEGVVQSFLTLDDENSTDVSVVDSYLKKNHPVIVKSIAHNRDGAAFSHFILGTSLLLGEREVNDPLWYNTENMDDDRDRDVWVQDYDNDVQSGRLFTFSTQSKKVARNISVYLASPAELVLTDSDGHRLGYDPISDTHFEEIPDGKYYTESAVYSEELAESGVDPHQTKILDVPSPALGEYTLSVIGTGDGEYNLTIFTVDGLGDSQTNYIASSTTYGHTDLFRIEVTDDANSGHGNEDDGCDEGNTGEGGACATIE